MERAYLFLLNKIKKRIEWANENYTFTRSVEDEYHRKQDDIFFTVKGLYHQTNSYQQKSSQDGSITTKKPQLMILCLYEDQKEYTVQEGDKTVINDKTMLVTGVVDLQNLHIAMQISLEVEV